MKFLVCLNLIALMCLTAHADDARIPFRNKKIVAFVTQNMGKKVGDGDCWDLGNAALVHAGGSRPFGRTFVWGRKLDPAKEAILPGDIVQTFTKGKEPAGPHTTVVMELAGGTKVKFGEQNWNKNMFVTTRDADLKTLGEKTTMYIYRPN